MDNAKPATLFRTLASMLYDSLLVLALVFVASLPAIAVNRALGFGDAIDPQNVAYQLWLLAVVYAFFMFFWTRKGRTLGMQSWHLRLEAIDGGAAGLKPASIRFFAAILSLAAAGAGYLWMLVDRESLSWHDRLSRTRLRHYPKKAASANPK